jgi:asparagine synthase (glutamine-hydrolysing)
MGIPSLSGQSKMCGFVLAYPKTPEARLSQSGLDRMDRSITHRGPDEHSQVCIGKVAIGHRRLAIIDLTGGQQPMTSTDGKLCIVFNGEFYNFAN